MPDTTTDHVLRAEISLVLRSPCGRGTKRSIANRATTATTREQTTDDAGSTIDGDRTGSRLLPLQGFHQHMREPKEKARLLRFGFWLADKLSTGRVSRNSPQGCVDLIDKLVDDGVADPSRLSSLLPQSCALNYRFAFSHPDRLRGIIGICGGIPWRLGN